MKGESPQLREVRLGGLSGLYRRSARAMGPPVVMLHGYGGDESVMWIFARGIPDRHDVYALRGLFPADEGGFRWHEGRRWPPPPADALAPSIDALNSAAEAIGFPGGVIWIGFSQGAAVSFGCAASGIPTAGVACLAGYLPQETALPRGLPVFWGHGVRDERVPIGAARDDVAALRAGGVNVEYCESDVGHKLGADCLRALRRWLETGVPSS